MTSGTLTRIDQQRRIQVAVAEPGGPRWRLGRLTRAQWKAAVIFSSALAHHARLVGSAKSERFQASPHVGGRLEVRALVLIALAVTLTSAANLAAGFFQERKATL